LLEKRSASSARPGVHPVCERSWKDREALTTHVELNKQKERHLGLYKNTARRHKTGWVKTK
jgi:hypothetical protein